MKKFSIFIIMCLLITSFTSSFAKDFSDISDSNVKKSVSKLVEFGIVDGLEDGRFAPNERVTREQFIKMLVSSIGLKQASQSAGYYSKFKDIEESRWSNGYINMAVSLSIVNGYSDGNFSPKKDVTFVEAIAMIARTLGYKDEFLEGSWPEKYMVFASNEGFTEKISKSSNESLNRAEVAILIDNALESRVLKLKGYDINRPKFFRSEEKLRESKLGIYRYEDVKVESTPKINPNLMENEVRIRLSKEYKIDEKIIVSSEDLKQNKVVIIKGKDSQQVNNLLAKSYDMYFLKDTDQVIYMQMK